MVFIGFCAIFKDIILSNYNIKRVIADEDYLQPTYTELFWQIQVSLLTLIKASNTKPNKGYFDHFLSLMLYSSEKN